MADRRRRSNFHQGPAVRSVAQPIHTFGRATDNYEQTWGQESFVHTEPAVDNSNDSLMAPPPVNLTLTVPGNGHYPQGWNHIESEPSTTYSPLTDGISPQQSSQEPFVLPSYGRSVISNNNNDWQPKSLDPTMFQMDYNTTDTMRKEQFQSSSPIGAETGKMMLDFPSSPTISTTHMTAKQRTAHRKAIEEKSSLKRKNAEQRLSRAITTRLGGTFVPGLANQMSQAAEIIEKDTQTIRELEEEISRLRHGRGVDVKVPVRFS